MNEWILCCTVDECWICMWVSSVCQAFAAFAWGHALWWDNTSSNTLFLQDSPDTSGHIFFFFLPNSKKSISFLFDSMLLHSLCGYLDCSFWLWWEQFVAFLNLVVTTHGSFSQEGRFHILTRLPSLSTQIILTLRGGRSLLTRKKRQDVSGWFYHSS